MKNLKIKSTIDCYPQMSSFEREKAFIESRMTEKQRKFCEFINAEQDKVSSANEVQTTRQISN